MPKNGLIGCSPLWLTQITNSIFVVSFFQDGGLCDIHRNTVYSFRLSGSMEKTKILLREWAEKLNRELEMRGHKKMRLFEV